MRDVISKSAKTRQFSNFCLFFFYHVCLMREMRVCAAHVVTSHPSLYIPSCGTLTLPILYTHSVSAALSVIEYFIFILCCAGISLHITIYVGTIVSTRTTVIYIYIYAMLPNPLYKCVHSTGKIRILRGHVGEGEGFSV